MGSEQRKDPRVPSYAKAILVGPQVLGYIRDLSRSGCQVAFMQPVKGAVGDLITVRVIAEHDQSIAPFEIRLRVRRVIQDPLWFALGTQIESMVNPQDAGAFERLVSYYSGPGR